MDAGERLDGDCESRKAAGGRRRSLSQRLMAALTREIRALERSLGGAETDESAAGAKGRVEAIGSLTRTLEKLFDLAKLEGEAAKGAAADGREAERLRAEMLRRLRALDARRLGGGGGLFAALGFSGPVAAG